MTSVYDADEAFVTGTFAGLIPVKEVDSRLIGDGQSRHVIQQLRQLYTQLIERYTR